MKFGFWFLILAFSAQSIYGFNTVNSPPPNNLVVERIKTFLSDTPVIVEAGTYDGQDTVELSKLLPEAQIYTFEPVPELFNKSAKRLESFNNIKIYNHALSDKTGKGTMYLSEQKGAAGIVSMSSSLLAPKEHLIYSPDTLFKNTIEVSTTTIDNWAEENNISTIDVLKLDIQGNELNVLMASPKILSTVKAVLIEVEFVEAYEGQYLFEEIKLWMEEWGFELDTLFNACGWFGDALFIRKK
ncbi:MAG: FkbM family methyltransferase [Verrucomicrobia bacterium]|nr:FkbM family methyltransferase [Verrucomicrobiota bacterium]